MNHARTNVPKYAARQPPIQAEEAGLRRQQRSEGEVIFPARDADIEVVEDGHHDQAPDVDGVPRDALHEGE